MYKSLYLKVTIHKPFSKTDSSRHATISHKNDSLTCYFSSKEIAEKFSAEVSKSFQTPLEALKTMKDACDKYDVRSYGNAVTFFGNLFLE